MPRARIVVIVLCVSSFVGSCAQPADQSAANRGLDTRLDELSKKVDELSKQEQSDRSKISSLEVNRTIDLNRNTSLALDPAKRGFGRIDANVGTFAVSLTDVHQFADGVKVRLTLGNLSSATFNGAKLTLKYGRREPNANDSDYVTKYIAWNSALREKEETLTERLLPAHWNPVQVVLPGIEMKDFGYLEVSIVTNEILMY